MGVLAYGGPRPRVLVALTQELGEVLTKMSTVSIERGEDASLCKGKYIFEDVYSSGEKREKRKKQIFGYCIF